MQLRAAELPDVDLIIAKTVTNWLWPDFDAVLNVHTDPSLYSEYRSVDAVVAVALATFLDLHLGYDDELPLAMRLAVLKAAKKAALKALEQLSAARQHGDVGPGGYSDE